MAANAAAGDAPPPPHVVEDCRGALLVLSDGTVIRSTPPIAAPEAVRADPSVEWKDAVYDATHGLRLRIYKPAAAAGDTKLPVVVYFHGGGFCIGSYAWPIFHAACTRLAADLPAVVLSADYRLAPEHRLPAAIDDAAAVLLWLRDNIITDPWLAEHADATRAFVAGESAGGVLVHHMNARFFSGTASEQLSPVRLRGFVQLMPFFAGREPTPSELACPDGAFLNRDMAGRYVRLSLPAGAAADHPFLNPFSPDTAPGLEGVDVGPTLVVVAGDDMLRDRNLEYVRRMKEMGKPVEAVEFKGQGHAFFSLRPWSGAVDEMVRAVKGFIDKVSAQIEL
ncbi:unnamed protein product [Urochloa decumbens]|uniref:Alpha/beta hydrolase fold-3 domain-containing protein n=1 Tax=Urochloa decumbens TaxID=240449 RepID=A0ABC9FM97_9POAL